MNNNYSEQKICATPGCNNPARRSGRYCISCRRKLTTWLKTATDKISSYEQLSLCPLKPVIKTEDLYYEDNKTELRDLEFSE